MICATCARYPKACRHLPGCPRRWDAHYEGIVLCMKYTWNFDGLPVEKDNCRCGRKFRHAPDVPARLCLKCSIDDMFRAKKADVRLVQEANIGPAAKGPF
jgi:hypothetical protein